MSRSNTGFGKDSLAPYQGDQGLDMLDSAGQPVVRFQSTALNYPNNSGWDVQTSSQVSPDGRSFQTETVAKTDGMEKIQGGIAEFKGHNNQRSMASHEGDDKNFVKKASEFSNSNLHEKVVIGDENSGMTEVKMTSTSSTSSSNVFSSSSTTVCDGEPTSDLIRNQNLHHNQNRDQLIKEHQQEQLQHTQNRERLFKEHQQEQLQHMQNREQLFKEHQQERRESQTVEERQRLEEINRHTQRDSSVSNAKVEQLNEQSKRLINVDKASPEYQRHVQELMSQPGEIISNTVEYPKPNVKMITTVKRLPDGTIVKNKRYETEEVSQDKAHSERFQKVSDNKTTYRNQNQNVNEQTRTNVTENPRGSPNSPYRNVNRNVELVDDDVSNVERVEKTSFSQVKKTSQHSSTVDSREERNNTWDQKEVTKKNSQDFSTHGFPSVKSNIRTQEYPSGRPQTEQLNAVSPDKSHPIMRATPTRDGGEAVVSEKSVTIKKKVTAERYVETEVASDAGASTYNDVQNFQQINENQTFYSPDSVVNSPHQPQHPNLPHQSHPRQPHQNVPHQQHHQNDIKIVHDFNTNSSPRNSQPQGVSVTSQNVQTSKQYNDTQRMTEREINEHGKFTQNREHFIDTHKVDRPSNQKPDFSTHGFPSVPGTNRTHDISPVPTSVAPSKVTQRKPDQVDKPRSSPVKEKELDATHRRFAASLRCSSPLDYTDSHRSSPSRTSVSSTRTFKREGSHDSASPSETSRISSTTVTRQTPRKSPAKEVHDAAAPRTHTTSTVTRTPKTVTKTTTTTIRTKLPHEAAKTANVLPHSSPRGEPHTTHPRNNKRNSTQSNVSEKEWLHIECDVDELYDDHRRPYERDVPVKKPSRRGSPLNEDFDSTVITQKSSIEKLRDSKHTRTTDKQTDERKPYQKSPKRVEKSPERPTSDVSHKSLTEDFDTPVLTQKTTIEKLRDSKQTRTTDIQTDERKPIEKAPKRVEKSPERRTSDVSHKSSKFIDNEKQHFKTSSTIYVGQHTEKDEPETPSEETEILDGAFISKNNIEPENTTPSYKKKGVTDRETFEDRCRHILGMDDHGTTPGSYKPSPCEEPVKKSTPKSDKIQPSLNDITIEDCPEYDEYLHTQDTYNIHENTVTIPLNKLTDDKEKRRSSQTVEEDTTKQSKQTTATDTSKTNYRNSFECDISQVEKINNQRKSPSKQLPQEPSSDSVLEFISYERGTEKPIKEPRGSSKITSKSVFDRKPHSPVRNEDKPIKSDTSESVLEFINLEKGTEKPIKEPRGTSKITSKSAFDRKPHSPVRNEDKPNKNGTSETVLEFSTHERDSEKPIKEPRGTSKITSKSVFDRKPHSPVRNEDKPIKNDTSETVLEFISHEGRTEKPIKEPRGTSKITSNSAFDRKPHSPERNEEKPTKNGTTSPKGKVETPKTPAKPKPTETRTSRIQPSTPSVPQKTNKSPVRESPVTRSMTVAARKPIHPTNATKPTKEPTKPFTRTSSRKSFDSKVEEDDVIDISEFSDKRRSSNISVHTEIIIEHGAADTTERPRKRPLLHKTTQDLLDTVQNEKPNKFTQRKDTAPVNQVKRNSLKDVKMSRSTSENALKTGNKTPQKPHDIGNGPSVKTVNRQNKCLTTKTINLSPKTNLYDNVDSESIVIDIQQAKSSREPSPDKIIPTPVPAHLDTGKPRYPDVVQEPEEERPKGVIKIIPTLHEESNEYISCHITEVDINKTHHFDSLTDSEQEVLVNPIVEAPVSLDYTEPIPVPSSKPIQPIETTLDDEPKVKNPWTNKKDSKKPVKDNTHDDCEEISEYINKSKEIRISSKVEIPSSRPILSPTNPQRAPKLVAKIERNILNQNESRISPKLKPIVEKNPQSTVQSRLSVFEKKQAANKVHSTYEENLKLSEKRRNSNTTKKITDRCVKETGKDKPTKPDDTKETDKELSPKQRRFQYVHTTNGHNKTSHMEETDNTEIKTTSTSSKTMEALQKTTESSKHTTSRSPQPIKTTTNRFRDNTPDTTRHIDNKENLYQTERYLVNHPKKPQNIATTKLERETITTKSVSSNVVEDERQPKSIPGSPVRRPSYMDDTQSSLTRKDSFDINKTRSRKQSGEDTTLGDSHTNSGMVKFDLPVRPKAVKPTGRKPSENQLNIEEIFDLDVLVKLLDEATSYEIRRRIRAQIRIVKNMLANGGKIPDQIEDNCSKVRKLSGTKKDDVTRDVEITRKTHKVYRELGTVKVDSEVSANSEEETDTTTITVKRVESKSPNKDFHRTSLTQSVISKGSVKKHIAQHNNNKKQTITKSNVNTTTLSDDLNATDDQQTKKVKLSFITKTTSKPSTQQREKSRSVEQKDSITSCYGIGPCDENGMPLFGLRALKSKQATSSTTDKENVNEMESLNNFKSLHKSEVNENAHSTSKEFSTSSMFVRRGSVKEISEKLLESSSQSVTEKSYPKAGLILLTSESKMKSSVGDDDNMEDMSTEDDDQLDQHDADSEMKLNTTKRKATKEFHVDEDSFSMENQSHFTTKQSTTDSRSFLNTHGSAKKVTSVNDVLERMRNADNVIDDTETADEREARSLLNKFIGASVMMKGVESMESMSKKSQSQKFKTAMEEEDNYMIESHLKTKEVKPGYSTYTEKSVSSSLPVTQICYDINDIWDLDLLKSLLDQASTYEQRRKIRERIRFLMAEREESTTEQTREETKEKDESGETVTTKVTTQTITKKISKPETPFNKFKQLDKENASKSPTTTTPTTPSGSAAIFKFTDPTLNAKAATYKDQLLQWCQMKTQEYENVNITNFSSCWTDGLAFCALIHHFLPDAFDYSQLTPKNRRHNFELAFTTADEKAGIAPLLDVEDMVVMKRPDWKCVFVYVQSIHRRFRNCQ